MIAWHPQTSSEGASLRGTARRDMAMRLTLGMEDLTLALWVWTTITAPSRSQLALVALGLVLGWLALRSLHRAPAEGRFFSWVLRLHRCLLPYTFPPADRVTEDPRLPVALRLCWLLLFKSGAANVAAVSLALCGGGHCGASPWLLLVQQLVLALLLARQAPAVWAAGASCAELDSWMQPVIAAFQLWDLQATWASCQECPPVSCRVVLATLIPACVVGMPVYAGALWGREGRPPAAGSRQGMSRVGAAAAAGGPGFRAGPSATERDLPWVAPSKAFVLVFLAVTVACMWEFFTTVWALWLR